jgi:lysosomal Pro-X carboxypeptidase
MHSQNCVDVIREAFKRLLDFSKNPSAPIANISTFFNLCQPLKSYRDIPLLIDYISAAYEYLAMLNYPYPTAFLKNLTAWPANSSCIPFNTITPKTQDS